MNRLFWASLSPSSPSLSAFPPASPPGIQMPACRDQIDHPSLYAFLRTMPWFDPHTTPISRSWYSRVNSSVRSSRYNVMSSTPKSGRRPVLASMSFASRLESGTPRVRTPTRARRPSKLLVFSAILGRNRAKRPSRWRVSRRNCPPGSRALRMPRRVFRSSSGSSK